MLVYGEKIDTEKLLIMDYNVIGKDQKYIPEINTKQVDALIRDIEQPINYIENRIQELFNTQAIFFPMNESVRKNLEQQISNEEKSLISQKDWVLYDES